MKWIIGIDLTPGSQGPLSFGSWLARYSTGEAGEQLVAAHVLPSTARLSPFVSTEELERLHPRAAQACRDAIAQAEMETAISAIELRDGDAIHETLAALASSSEADAIVIGRRAKRGENKLSRLGPVARRLLRSLPAPIVVVPPDFDASEPRDGPVILATDCSENSVAAGRFAEDVSHRLDCDLLVVHVVPTLDWAIAYLPPEAIARVRAESKEIGRAELASWAQLHALWGAQTEILHGDPPVALAELARQKNASLLVCGSRKLSASARVFVPSLASELAASAWCPVAVVPPPAT